MSTLSIMLRYAASLTFSGFYLRNTPELNGKYTAYNGRWQGLRQPCRLTRPMRRPRSPPPGNLLADEDVIDRVGGNITLD